jgi:Ca2+:H+ antiporter
LTDVFVWLLLLVPATAAAAYLTGPESLWSFAAATLGVIPLAEWIRRATEHLARRAGPAIGGLLNVSFGNTAELVLALFVLAAGKPDVVKAQLTGSIIGNSLLGLGLAIVVGSIGRDKQTFKRARAGQLSSLLVLSMIGLLLPALFDYVVRGSEATARLSRDEHFSLSVSVVLILVYVANLIYTLVTHRDVFAFAQRDDEAAGPGGTDTAWPIWKALAILAVATTATALEAHFISGALTPTALRLGLSEFFLGVIPAGSDWQCGGVRFGRLFCAAGPDGTGHQHHGRFDYPDRAARGSAAGDRVGNRRPPHESRILEPAGTHRDRRRHLHGQRHRPGW